MSEYSSSSSTRVCLVDSCTLLVGTISSNESLDSDARASASFLAASISACSFSTSSGDKLSPTLGCSSLSSCTAISSADASLTATIAAAIAHSTTNESLAIVYHRCIPC